MIKLHKLIATVFGIGYVGKGGGTLAAVACCIIWILVPAKDFTGLWQVLILILVCVLGVWSGNVVDSIWGKDSSKVVIDEVAGMMLSVLLIPVTIKYILTGLVLFRFFDIVKPFFIRKMEVLPKGWGVMADDLLAGIYSNIILQLVVFYQVF
jgi:phosphatidylglycerophosphatase A